MFFCPLASGSKGNLLFVESATTTLLIDFGLSFREVKKRLSLIDRSIEDVDAIIITHEHHDHIQGLASLSRKHQIPLIVSRDTAKVLYRELGLEMPFRLFSCGESFCFGDFEITPFSIQHDTIDPVGLRLESDGVVIGIATDLGCVTPLVTKALEGCQMLYVEANHEPSRVHASSRPALYKQRVLGPLGHLSNQEAASLILTLSHEGLQRVYLAHLSSECNTPEAALECLKKRFLEEGKALPEVEIALQEAPSPPWSFKSHLLHN